MKIPLEWVMEFLTVVALFGIILVSMHMQSVSDSAIPMETYEGVQQDMQEGKAEEKGRMEKRRTERKGEEVFSAAGEHQINHFHIVLQNPELPTGCEITSMTMVLNYYGMEVDKMTMAMEYLPKTEAEFYFDKEGNLYGADMEQYFLGNPAEEEGYICGAGAIQRAADRYLRESGSSMRALDKTGTAVKEVYQWVSEDTPVVVWVTINMEEREVVEGWYTESGGYVDWGRNDHGAVLIGYTPDTVSIADPIAGKVVYSRKNFEEVFASRGNQCVILK